MSPEAITKLLKAKLPDCEIYVEVNGSRCHITAIGEIFEGKRPVQRQQLVYRALSTQISEGRIHAVAMKTFTSEEWHDDKKVKCDSPLG